MGLNDLFADRVISPDDQSESPGILKIIDPHRRQYFIPLAECRTLHVGPALDPQ
jgi:hypothetical protein